MLPEKILKILEEINKNSCISIIFQYPKTDFSEAELKILEVKDNLREIYTIDNYSSIYLSVCDLPASSQDWEFFDDSAEDLIEITGGRTKENLLEMCEVRIFSKVTNTKKVFSKIKKMIISACSERGLYSKSGNFYRNIYYASEVLRYNLQFDLRMNDLSFTLVRKVENSTIKS
jgi:hypothetical protein